MRVLKTLKERDLLSEADEEGYEALSERYDIGVNGHVLSTIQNKDAPLSDPVGRQYIPSLQELNTHPLEQSDPIGDEAHSPVKGIVHRYPDRVLLKITSVCAVYCRYCFRKEGVGARADHLTEEDITRAMEYIASSPRVREVILTGGDPLVLSARRLEKILGALDRIDHIKMIRIHSRVPIANPRQIKDTIPSVLKNVKTPITLVLHANHAQEITQDVKACLSHLRDGGVMLLSQSVLLKGVNDDTAVLETLFCTLLEAHVKPYYLHHMDRAKGTAHFYVPIEKGQALMRDLRGRISGTALPTYVLDIPGGFGKVPVNADYVRSRADGLYDVTDPKGRVHKYRE